MRLLVFILLLSCSSSQANKLSSFATDGCSLYPNGTWLHCCLVHDMSYWIGGEQNKREETDKELGQCLAKNGSSVNAKLMVGGVHLGGGANDVLPWAWGYGWKKNPGYKTLSSRELKEVEAGLDSVIPVMREYEDKLSEKQFEYILKKFQELRVQTAKELQK